MCMRLRMFVPQRSFNGRRGVVLLLLELLLLWMLGVACDRSSPSEAVTVPAGLEASGSPAAPLGSGVGPTGASPALPPGSGAGSSPLHMPPTNFAGVIPEDLPDFPGGIDGTEFVPDPFFYGEETWDGLSLRLKLYLAWQARDLASVALSQGKPEEALNAYTRLEQSLVASPLAEPVLIPMEERILELSRRARVALLLKLERRTEALTLSKALTFGPGPLEEAARAFFMAALHVDKAVLEASLEEAEQRLEPLVKGTPWTPTTSGPAATQSQRHSDRLERLQTFVSCANPLEGRPEWGSFDAEASWRLLAARAVAIDVFLHGEPTWSPGSFVHHPGLELAPVSRGRSLLETLELATRSIKKRGLETDPQRLQGMPTGDSYVDLLGAPGSPAVGRLARLSLEDPSHLAWTARYVDLLNEAVAGHRTEQLYPSLSQMVRELEQHPFKSRYFNIKQVRNEGVRLLTLSHRFDEGLSLLKGFYPLQSLDFRVPARQGVLEGIRGRILLEAERFDEARQALEAGWGHTMRWLGYVATYRGRPLPPRAGGRP